jgi:hypothetical protein
MQALIYERSKPNQKGKCSRKRRDGETERVHAAVLEQDCRSTYVAGWWAMPQYWPMRPANATSMARARQPASARGPTDGTRHGNEAPEAPRARGTAKARGKPKRPSDPHAGPRRHLTLTRPCPCTTPPPCSQWNPPNPSRARPATRLRLRVGRVPARSPTYPAARSHVPLPLRASDWPPRPS